MTTTETFKFRAELSGDLQNALAIKPPHATVTKLNIEHLTLGSEDSMMSVLPDIEVTIGLTNMDLNDVRRWLDRVDEGHVMMQSVALEKDYTGERKYQSVEEIIAGEPEPV